LDHGRLRAAHRSRHQPDPIDLGNEPPLSVDGENSGLVDRRRISVQWFSGTILTGFCGAALMGGAVFASLDGETNFASVPERVESALRGAVGNIGDRLAGVRKGDKLPTAVEPNVTRQVIRVSTTSHAGNRELVRVRPFVRVAGNLSLTLSEISANIPPFNPQRMLAESSGDEATADNAPATEPDAEVSFVTRDLNPMLPRAKIAVLLPIDDVLMRVREATNWKGPKPQPKTAFASLDPSLRLAYATEGSTDPYEGFEARIVPENVTFLPKTAKQTTGGNTWNERNVTVKKGDSISSIVRDLGATAEEAKNLSAALGALGRDGGLKDGLKLRILMSPVPAQKRMQPIRVIVADDNAIEAVVALSDLGKYVAVDARTVDTDTVEVGEDEVDDGTGVRLYQSIYETALRNQLPASVIDDLIRLYSYDVDFQRKVLPGDSFEVLYAGEEETPGAEGKSDVMFASLSVGGESKKFYRFQTPDDSVVDYYDEDGKSAKKFLVRKPVGSGILRSGFGFRRHPILGIAKMHTGIDWGAPTGTPIYASGNGTIEKAGWESGYGKYVRVKHANGYETAYGHMTAFARGIEPGVRVRQGQVIGFVGSTGLSTGAHLHYEILVNGRFVDPMRIKLPRGRVLDGPVLADFERERGRLDNIMTRSPSRVAQSNLPSTR
jgi:murein DD-endopeptidase MepM/ murein hydrolase activator NlpD